MVSILPRISTCSGLLSKPYGPFPAHYLRLVLLSTFCYYHYCGYCYLVFTYEARYHRRFSTNFQRCFQYRCTVNHLSSLKLFLSLCKDLGVLLTKSGIRLFYYLFIILIYFLAFSFLLLLFFVLFFFWGG